MVGCSTLTAAISASTSSSSRLESMTSMPWLQLRDLSQRGQAVTARGNHRDPVAGRQRRPQRLLHDAGPRNKDDRNRLVILESRLDHFGWHDASISSWLKPDLCSHKFPRSGYAAKKRQAKTPARLRTSWHESISGAGSDEQADQPLEQPCDHAVADGRDDGASKAVDLHAFDEAVANQQHHRRNDQGYKRTDQCGVADLDTDQTDQPGNNRGDDADDGRGDEGRTPKPSTVRPRPRRLMIMSTTAPTAQMRANARIVPIIVVTRSLLSPKNAGKYDSPS